MMAQSVPEQKYSSLATAPLQVAFKYRPKNDLFSNQSTFQMLTVPYMNCGTLLSVSLLDFLRFKF